MRSWIAVAAVASLALVAVPLAAAKAPTAVTGATTLLGATTAVVAGKVDPGGEATSWYVEYGTSPSYGSRTDARSAGNGTAPVDVTEQLRGLTTGATYHYRLVAMNAAGTGRGADQTFSTRAAPTVVTSPAWALGPTSATVGGTVGPNGRSTGWWVEYGSWPRTTSARPAEPTARSAPTSRRPSRRVGRTASASPRRASADRSTPRVAAASPGSSTGRRRRSGRGRATRTRATGRGRRASTRSSPASSRARRSTTGLPRGATPGRPSGRRDLSRRA